MAVVGRSKARPRTSTRAAVADPSRGRRRDAVRNGRAWICRRYPLDGPLPEVPLTNSQQGRQKVIVEMARRENLTIRQLYQRVAGARGAPHDLRHGERDRRLAGALVHERRRRRLQHPVADLPDGLDDFADQVDAGAAAPRAVPHAIRGATLRENLGLPRPANRFVEDKRQTAAE